MPGDNTMDDEEPSGGSIFSLQDEGQFVATVVQYDEVPDECTIHPLDATEEELMTCWVTALEGSFVSVRDVR